jgi:hypothetical protein
MVHGLPLIYKLSRGFKEEVFFLSVRSEGCGSSALSRPSSLAFSNSFLGLRGQVDRVSWNTTGFSFAREIRVNEDFPYLRGSSFWHNGQGVSSVGERITGPLIVILQSSP